MCLKFIFNTLFWCTVVIFGHHRARQSAPRAPQGTFRCTVVDHFDHRAPEQRHEQQTGSTKTSQNKSRPSGVRAGFV